MSSTLRFQHSPTPEPHAQRRRLLLARDPGIRSLFGFDRRTAYVTFAVAAGQLAVAFGLRHASGLVVLAAALLLGAPLTHWLSMSIHETSHRLAARTMWANQVIALVANVPMLLPVAMSFHRYHLEHHRSLNVLGADTDLPLDVEVRRIGSSAWRKLAWLFFHPLVYLARGATFALAPNRGELLNAALMLGIDLLLWKLLGGTAVLYLAVSFYFAHGLHPVAGHFIHEHYTFAPGQETFSYYGPLNALTFNVGYHNEHHDFMNVPGWRLPELKRRVPEYGELVSHRSWTFVLWRFITDPAMGAGSRIVRTPADFQRGRARRPVSNVEVAHVA
jgi:sphingolipid delta-4 desaturase